MTSNKNECSSKCPGKQPCALDPAVRHTLHLCPDPTCLCHQHVRYQASRPQRQRTTRKQHTP